MLSSFLYRHFVFMAFPKQSEISRQIWVQTKVFAQHRCVAIRSPANQLAASAAFYKRALIHLSVFTQKNYNAPIRSHR